MRVSGLFMVHERQKFLVKIPRNRIERGMKRLLAHVEKMGECEDFVIEDGLLPVLDFGNRAAADVQSLKLELGGKLLLRPSPLASESPNLRAYDIAFLHRAGLLLSQSGRTSLAQ